jgi:hypothetical protein
MPKSVFFLVCFATLFMPLRESTSANHLFPGHVGLVLVARTPEGFAMAADGSQSNADGTVSEIQKIFPVGKQGAILFAGAVSIQDPVDRPVREEVNIPRISEAWLGSHPDADIQTANREINSLVLKTLAKFLSTRGPGKQAGKYSFAIVCAGFQDGKPWVSGSRYFFPRAKGQAVRVESVPNAGKSEEVWIFGDSKVPTELISGKSNALPQLRAKPPVEKFPQDKSTAEFIKLFDTILQAAESEKGNKFDHAHAIVAPPNRLATITIKDGFQWSK